MTENINLYTKSETSRNNDGKFIRTDLRVRRSESWCCRTDSTRMFEDQLYGSHYGCKTEL